MMNKRKKNRMLVEWMTKPERERGKERTNRIPTKERTDAHDVSGLCVVDWF